MPRRTTSRTCNTRRRACCDSRKISSASVSSRRPISVRIHRRVIASTLRVYRGHFERSRRRCRRSSSYSNTEDTRPPTMSKSFVSAALIVALAGCSGGPLPYMQGGAPLHSLTNTGAGKIKHVVYIVQENRSFDNLFQGYPGADTVSSGKDSKGETIQLAPVKLSQRAYVIDHSAAAMFSACHGTGSLPGTKCRMDGFDTEQFYGGPSDVKYPMYVYVPHGDSRPYFDIAHEGVLADRMFQSHLDESFVSHQYIIAAQAQSSVDLPYGAWGCSAGTGDTVPTITKDRTYGRPQQPCFDYQTLGDGPDGSGLT